MFEVEGYHKTEDRIKYIFPRSLRTIREARDRFVLMEILRNEF